MSHPKFIPSPYYRIGQVVVYKQSNNDVIIVDTIKKMCWLPKLNEWRYYLNDTNPLKSMDIIPYNPTYFGTVDLRDFPNQSTKVEPDITNL